jgi:hypothetical protein
MDERPLSVGLDGRIKKDKVMKLFAYLALVIALFISCEPGAPKSDVLPTDYVRLPSEKDSVYSDSLHSEITCPKCAFKRTELLPTEVCLLRYKCSACQYEMTPKDGDCCVFCSYGTHKCPSKQ